MTDSLINQWLVESDRYKSVSQALENALIETPWCQLNLNEFYVLYYLAEADGKKMRLQELGPQIGLSSSAVSRLVVKMEAKSCHSIERTICDEDKRGLYVRLTRSGKELLTNLLPLIEEVLASYNKV